MLQGLLTRAILGTNDPGEGVYRSLLMPIGSADQSLPPPFGVPQQFTWITNSSLIEKLSSELKNSTMNYLVEARLTRPVRTIVRTLMLKKTIPMMVTTMQRPPTIAGAEGLVSDPLSSSALRLLHEQKNYPPRAEQGRATSTHLLPSWSSRSHRRRRRRKPREANFLTVWHFFERPAKLARGGPAPWSTRMLNPGEETCSVLVYWQPVCI